MGCCRRSNSQRRVVLIGLDGAGKTTVLRQLVSRGAPPDTLPTIGFTVQELVLDGLRLTLFDVGGQEKIRELWSQYCRAADALVLVVDAGDHSRLADVRAELAKLLHGPGAANLSQRHGQSLVLVLANKQDQQRALSPAALVANLRLHEIDAAWHVEGTVGLDGTGIDAGFDWLCDRLSHHAARGSAVGGALARSRRGAGAGAAPERERRGSLGDGHLRALHGAAQELDAMRLRHEQLAARVLALEQRNAELARENAALRAAVDAGDEPDVQPCPRGTPVADVRRRAIEARASADAVRKQNSLLSEGLRATVDERAAADEREVGEEEAAAAAAAAAAEPSGPPEPSDGLAEQPDGLAAAHPKDPLRI